MKLETETLNISSKTQYIKLTGEDIINLLKLAGLLKINKGQEIKVEFVVPTGADWSGMELDVDKDNPVVVTISSPKKKRYRRR